MVGDLGLLDRDEELLRIEAAIADPGRVLVVEGEPGIGKTSLLMAAAGLARDAGATVFSACGATLEREFGYGVARQLFEAPLRAATAQRGRWLAGAAALARPALGLDTAEDAGERVDPAFAAQHGLYWLVANIADETPLVLIVDDLHWADLASFRWLVYLARRIDDLPVLLLAGWRSGDPTAPQGLLDALGAQRVVPRSLSVTAATSLMRRGLGRQLDARTALACHQATRGNPLLLSHLAEALDADVELPLDTGQIAALGARAVARHVRGRLAGFAPATAEVAAAAAVLDSEIAPRHLAQLTGAPLHEVRIACDELVHGHVLTGRDTLAFAHPLVRAAIYEQLSPVRRAAAHRAAADILDREGQPDRAAVHLVGAERTADAGVAERLAIAAHRALTRGAVDEAVVLLSRALEEPPTPPQRFELMMMLSHAQWLAGDEAAIEHAYSALALADGGDQREAAATRLAQLLSPAGRAQEAVDVLARTADELREIDPQRAVKLDVQRVSWSLMLPQPPAGITQTVLSLSGEVKPGTLSADILNGTIAFAAANACALPAATAATIAQRALADNRMVEDLSVTAPFYWPLIALAYCERLDESSAWAQRREACAARTGSRIATLVLATHRAHLAWLRGDLAGAEEEARAALSDSEVRGFTFYVPFATALLAATLVERGQPDRARQLLDDERLADEAEGHDARRPRRSGGLAQTMLVAARVMLALAVGDIDEARACLSATRARSDQPLRLAPAEITVALASGARDEARERASAMLDLTARFGAPGAHGIAQRLLGLATGGSQGRDLLCAAIDSLQRSPRRLELARALIDYGAALRRAKQRAAAREPLRRGLDLSQRCGARALADHAAQELRASGARPRRLVLTGIESLTPSELRVAQLVAQGRSNPEVAQSLFVTRATIETHLHAVYRKLDISRREQLAAVLAA